MDGNNQFYLTVAIRNFIDYNYVLKNTIRQKLIKSINIYLKSEGFITVKVNSLPHFKGINSWVSYMHKEIVTWRYKGFLCICKDYYRGANWEGFDGRLVDIYNFYIKPNNSVVVKGIELNNLGIYNVDEGIIINLTG